MFDNISIKFKILSALVIIVFFSIITYLIPDEEWGIYEFNIYERLLFCCNIQIGTFGFIDTKIFPITERAKFILLIQRITSYIFRIILFI